MGKHYTSNTVSVSHWCGKCNRNTQHRIDDHRVGPCLECIEKLDKAHGEKKAAEPAAEQKGFKW